MVRVSFTADSVDVKDLRSAGAALSFTHAEWSAFVKGVRQGEFLFGIDPLPDGDPSSLDDDEP